MLNAREWHSVPSDAIRQKVQPKDRVARLATRVNEWPPTHRAVSSPIRADSVQ